MQIPQTIISRRDPKESTLTLIIPSSLYEAVGKVFLRAPTSSTIFYRRFWSHSQPPIFQPRHFVVSNEYD